MKKRNIIVLVLLLVIGFASVSTTLILNGTIGIAGNDNDFDVIFTSAKINGEGSSVTISETKKKITFSSSKLTSVGEKAILDYKIKNNSTQYDADVTINCTNEASEYISITNELEGEEITENYKTTFTAQEVKSGVITAELIKSSTEENDSAEVTCTIVASATERDSVIEPVKYSWEITEDNDNNGELSNGDLITLGTESFYVYNIEGDIIKAISQYNLEVGNSSNSAYPVDEEKNIQSSRAIGFNEKGITTYATISYSKSYKHGEKMNSYIGSIIEEYVNNYIDILKDKYDVEVTGRLITKEELENLGCNSSSHACSSAPTYVYSTSYWTSSPTENNGVVWIMSSVNYFGSTGADDGAYYGVRPVIEIQKSEFE